MTKSFCIKINSEKIINYLLIKYQSIKYQDHIRISVNRFKHYRNIIIHYSGNDLELFLKDLATIISECIITFFEKYFIKKRIFSNYFYFIDEEQRKIFYIVYDFLSPNTKEYNVRNNYLFVAVLEYIKENKSMILEGFFNFRIQNYKNFLDYIIELSVNSYILEKEYLEFVNLLRMYVKSEDSKYEEVHLIYKRKKAIILDNNLKLINLEDEIFKTHYLSDISFSNNDLALNTLLNLIPQKINIHLIDNEDEFIKTLKLIFENRIYICKNCSICNLYKYKNNVLNKK